MTSPIQEGFLLSSGIGSLPDCPSRAFPERDSRHKSALAAPDPRFFDPFPPRKFRHRRASESSDSNLFFERHPGRVIRVSAQNFPHRESTGDILEAIRRTDSSLAKQTRLMTHAGFRGEFLISRKKGIYFFL
jgi:hypothetical protein